MVNTISKLCYQEERQKLTTVLKDDDSVPLLLRLSLEEDAEADWADKEQNNYYQSSQAPPLIEPFDKGSSKTVHIPSISQAKDTHKKKTVGKYLTLCTQLWTHLVLFTIKRTLRN